MPDKPSGQSSPPPTPGQPSSASYVYPIRSLLSGVIQPEVDSDRLSSGNVESLTTDLSGRTKAAKRSDVQSWSRDVTESTSEDDAPGPSTQSKSTKKRLSVLDPNFRHFPAEADQNPYFPRTFSSVTPGESSQFSPVLGSAQAEQQRRRGDSIAATAEEPQPKPDSEYFNPSEYGLVHLPPLPPSPTLSQPPGSSHHSQNSVYHSAPSSQDVSQVGSQASSNPAISETGNLADDENQPSTDDASQLVLDSRSSRTSSSASTSSEVALVSFRFEHMEDENGHHVVVGREGKLSRCEDEPIRTPGAVQGFGVLIVVDEGPDGQALVVRQVSENAEQILGLSPKFLFSLECFTDTLPDAQADHLWDNIQFLNEPEYNAEEEEDSPHVFLLTGYGQPGSASDADIYGNSQGRHIWTCWCAVHRPTHPPDKEDTKRSLIILEFELEKDSLNPLYPPVSVSSATASGEDSPASTGSGNSGSNNSSTVGAGSSGSLGGSSGGGSDTTLVAVPTANNTNTPINETPPAAQANEVTPTLDAAATPTQGAPQTTPTQDDVMPTMPAPSPLQPSSHTSNNASIAASTTDERTITPPPTENNALQPREEWTAAVPASLTGLEGEDEWTPSVEDIFESTTSRSKPLPALERLRRMGRPNEPTTPSSPNVSGMPPRARRAARRASTRPGVGMMDIFAVMGQINEQLGAAPNLEVFLQVTVGLIKDLTQFHRVLVYQFDEQWNGQVVAELVDWSQSHDLYRGLHFPASDIPAQARELYAINKVRLLYDRSQSTARLVCRSRSDLEYPLSMTHCFLRAMSPIHIKYLGNMGVRASMSVSIVAFGALWGLVTCHSYGDHGMRVSFPVRQMLKLLSQSISKNIERLSYAQRLHTRKLINTLTTDNHPTGYIVSNADDLLGLFDADFGILVIGEGAKILGPNFHGQEILIVAEYLRLKRFGNIQASQAVTLDYPDLHISTGLEVIAGLLYVPLSHGGKDFIAFLRKGQPRSVHWAGRPHKEGSNADIKLEPRKSFKIWSETVAGRCRRWTDEQLETAGVLALVYGKFIEVWRQKENAMQTTRLTNLLLSNASHEVRTPLNHIINYLEMALNGPLDLETRDNLSRSHAASKSLLFTINDLLDLTRLESGGETSFNEPFDLHNAIQDALSVYKHEAERRNIEFFVDIAQSPSIVLGDSKKIRTVIQNLTANSLKYTKEGRITVSCTTFGEPDGLRASNQTAVEIVVADTGCGMSPEKLESIFREFEQVESAEPKTNTDAGVGLGLAVVARIVEQLGGQLRVDSKVDHGSRFSFLIPLALMSLGDGSEESLSSSNSISGSSNSQALSAQSAKSILLQQQEQQRTSGLRVRRISGGSHGSEVDQFVEAISSSHLSSPATTGRAHAVPPMPSPRPTPGAPGTFDVTDSNVPIRPVKVDNFEMDTAIARPPITLTMPPERRQPTAPAPTKLRVLVVEDNDINRTILAKRLKMNGHVVVNTTNGQEGLDMVKGDAEFDCVLMDIQMPILNGFEATERIRAHEKETNESRPLTGRLSQALNGRIPIFAVSASLQEQQREELRSYGIDGWILKPIDFKRLSTILQGVVDPEQRERDLYRPGCSWEIGGWLCEMPNQSPPS